MPPKPPPPEQPELFHSALVNLIDRRHHLERLAGLIDWERFATPPKPLGPMATSALHPGRNRNFHHLRGRDPASSSMGTRPEC
jgi:hypothetical protein